MKSDHKVLVLFYPNPSGEYNSLPYPLLFLERALRTLDVELKLIDERFDDSLLTYIRIKHKNILAVGFSVIYGNQLISASEKAAIIKKKHPDIPLIWGGYFPSWLPELLIKEDWVDYVIKGSGEMPLKRLIECLLNNQTDTNNIPGLFYKLNKHIHSCKPDHHAPFSWPDINYQLININNYVDNGNLHYIASLGCSHLCNFCFVSQTWKGKYYCMKADKIIDDIRYFIKKAPNIKYISFDDTNFFTHKENVMEFCHKLLAEGISIKWCGTTRISEFLTLYSDNDIQILKRAGCDTVYTGAESGDEQVLKALNKKLGVAEIIGFTNKLQMFGIKPSLSFMVLFPDNPDADLNKTLKLIMKLKLSAPELIFTMNAYIPMRKNRYFFVAKEMGWVFPNTIKDIVDFIKNPQILPWQKKSHFRKLHYFADYYFRFNSPDYFKKFPKKQRWFYKCIWQFSHKRIKKRFLHAQTNNTLDAALILKLIDLFESLYPSPFKTGQEKYMTPRAKNF